MMKSNITIKSNIYPREGMLSYDKDFIKQVNSRLALEKLHNYISFNETRDLSPIQRDIYKNELKKCMHNKDGDITNGVINIGDKLKWACRCEEIDCSRFNGCRPSISDAEIENIIQRKILHWNSLDDKRKMEEKLDKIKLERDLIVERFFNKDKKVNELSKIQKECIDDLVENIETIDLKRDVAEIIEVTDIIESTEEEIALALDIDYDEESNIQEIVISSSYKDRILVDAPPGTGKTYTLIERIKNLILEQEIDPDELIVLSFSRAAIGEINKRVKDAFTQDDSNWDLSKIDIRTFDSFATYVVGEMEEDLFESLYKRDYDERIEYCIDIIKKYPEIFSSIKHIIVDEIQDLVGVRARLVQSILESVDCGFTLLGDSCQSIYDYQVREKISEMDSKRFNKWLKDTYGNILNKYTFNKNYRQSRELINKTYKLREAILNKSELYQVSIAKDIINGFTSIGKTINLNSNMLESNEKVAILCRNNGQALKISKELMHQDIDHILQKASTFKLLEPWVAEIFNYDDSLRINEEEFKRRMFELVPEYKEVNLYWNIFKDIEGNKGSYIDIEELSKKLAYKKMQYEQIVIDRNSNIIVSTIHKSKGKEFDKVILLDESVLERFDDISEEVKTYYVALTRSKEKIRKVSFSRTFYASKNRNNANRWVSTYLYYGKQKISEIEVGREGDIDISSFISRTIFSNDEEIMENQQYIRNNVKRNDRIQLRFFKDLHDEMFYDIYHFGKRIGRMSKEFTCSIHQVHYMKHGDYTYMPNEINEIFVDEICSYVGDDRMYSIGLAYERKKIWNGVSIIGFGSKKTYKKY